jgi:hypothetical protein
MKKTKCFLLHPSSLELSYTPSAGPGRIIRAFVLSSSSSSYTHLAQPCLLPLSSSFLSFSFHPLRPCIFFSRHVPSGHACLSRLVDFVLPGKHLLRRHDALRFLLHITLSSSTSSSVSLYSKSVTSTSLFRVFVGLFPGSLIRPCLSLVVSASRWAAVAGHLKYSVSPPLLLAIDGSCACTSATRPPRAP